MISQTQEPEDLKFQLQDLLAIHTEIFSLAHRLQAEQGSWPEETTEDFDRIKNACQCLKDLLDGLKTARPSPNENAVAFWSKQRHDLRTPINGIKNYSEMIIEGLENREFPDHFMKLIQCAEKTLPIIDCIGRDIETSTTNNFINSAPGDNDAWHVAEGGTVLIIDDNNDTREVLSRRLRKAGLTVLEAEGGDEGLKVVEENNIDLILLDIMMPRLNGYEVLDRLKAKDTLSHIPVLMISSVNEIGSIVRCIEAGADDYLPTPFNPVLLKARISACLEKKRHTDKEKAFTNELETAQRQLEAAIESIGEGFAIFDSNDQLVKYNSPFKKLYSGLFNTAAPHISYDTFLKENLANGTFSPDRRSQESPKDWFDRHLVWHEAPHAPIVERIIPLNIWVEIREYKTPDGGTVSIHKDISKRKAEEERLSHLAHHDALTGIGNRTHFERSLKENIEVSKEGGSSFSLLFLDLDDFKAVNDSLGHEFGDHLLREVAGRIGSCLRTQDVSARLGGDEFGILISETQGLEATKRVAKRILKVVGFSVSHDGKTAQFGVSIGISSYPEDGDTFEDLFKAADKAMYAAKKSGKGQYKIYSEIQENS